MKLGYFQVLTRPQIGQDHAQRLSVERENQLGGGQRLTRLLVMTNGQWTNVHTEISPKMPDSLLLSQGGADSQLWDYEFPFCSFFMCDRVQLPHCWNFTFGCTALSECSRLR